MGILTDITTKTCITLQFSAFENQPRYLKIYWAYMAITL